jgi:hypothetical protein
LKYITPPTKAPSTTKIIIHFDQRNLPFFAIILYTGPVVLNQTGATAGRLPEFAAVSIVVIAVWRRRYGGNRAPYQGRIYAPCASEDSRPASERQDA